MHFRGEEVQPLQHLVMLGSSAPAPAPWLKPVGDHLDNYRTFGHDLTAVEAQCRDLALGVQLQIILSIFRFLARISTLDGRRQAGVKERDVWG